MVSDYVKEAALRFRRQRNNLTPFHRLPSDLFIDILRIALHRPADSSKRRYYPSLTSLRLVAASWDTIIKSTRRLWTSVPTCSINAAFIGAIAERSNPLPLDVFIYYYGTERGRACVLEANRHAQRWKSVDIYLEAEEDLEEIMKSPTPNLRSFSVRAAPELNIRREYDTDDLVFKGDLPPLERASLRTITVPWQAPCLQGLKELYLEFLGYNIPSIDQLLHILHLSPDLRILSIWSSPIRGSPTSTEIVTLPHLLELRLCNLESTNISDLITHMSTPLARIISVRPRDRENTSDLVRLGHDLALWLPSNSKGPKHLPFICTLEDRNMELKWGGGKELGAKGPGIDVDVPFSPRSLTFKRIAEICSTICAAMSPESTHLRIDAHTDGLEHLLSIEPHLPNVTQLYLGKKCSEVAFRAVDALSRRQESNWLYPKLVELEIWTPQRSVNGAVLEEYIRRRWVQGMGEDIPSSRLKRLTLSTWVPEETIRNLQKLCEVKIVGSPP